MGVSIGVMGYMRFRRTRSLVPGVRMNLSKSGVSWTFGPRGMHYTVGGRGTRTTVGVPGTGLSYTSYSHAHARQATRARATGGRQRTTSTAPAPPRRASAPMLPRTRMVIGAVLAVLGLPLILLPVLGIPLLLLGALLVAVGWSQHDRPIWRARALLRQAAREPARADELTDQAATVDPDNAEVLGARADLRFREHRWPEAAESYEKYLALAPDDILATGHAGNAWMNADQLDRAIPLLIRARDDLRLDEDSRAGLTAVLGMVYLKKGQPDQAAVVAGSQPLSRHTLSDGLQQCLFIRAMAQYGVGHRARGIADLDRLARLNPAFEHLEETRQEMLTGTFVLPSAAVAPSGPTG